MTQRTFSSLRAFCKKAWQSNPCNGSTMLLKLRFAMTRKRLSVKSVILFCYYEECNGEAI